MQHNQVIFSSTNKIRMAQIAGTSRMISSATCNAAHFFVVWSEQLHCSWQLHLNIQYSSICCDVDGCNCPHCKHCNCEGRRWSDSLHDTPTFMFNLWGHFEAYCTFQLPHLPVLGLALLRVACKLLGYFVTLIRVFFCYENCHVLSMCSFYVWLLSKDSTFLEQEDL